MSRQTEVIPVSAPVLEGEERPYVEECLANGWVSGESPMVARFEERFAARCGRGHGVAVASGTAALEVAVAALGLGQGDEVILPTFTIVSCALAVVRAGGLPRYSSMRTPAPGTCVRAMSPPRCRLAPRRSWSSTSTAFPSTSIPSSSWRAPRVFPSSKMLRRCTGRPTKGGRAVGDSTFSFYANKLLTTGEGGMVLTNDAKVAERCRSLRSLGHLPGQRFHHEELAWGVRLSSLQAALGLGQLDRLDRSIRRRREIGARYQQLLGGIAGIELPVAKTSYADNIYWAFGVTLKDEVPFDADAMRRSLLADGVDTRSFFWPIDEQPVFQRQGLFRGERYPVAERSRAAASTSQAVAPSTTWRSPPSLVPCHEHWE